MGRGRAKAKQTKVARELKYNSGGFDANRLSSELGVSTPPPPAPVKPEPVEDDDPYAAYADRYNDYDDEEADSGTQPGRR
ncbi:DUF3073 domain-containing protein [Kitasatospora sp. NPDC096147]|uniref:DUF3073 domain-containing protein n=1 Tax=Kitasatospora sp. NPDC096147 TaxID=3364093 RepID=UPI00380142CA